MPKAIVLFFPFRFLSIANMPSMSQLTPLPRLLTKSLSLFVSFQDKFTKSIQITFKKIKKIKETRLKN
jgi:hypothetical protein